jgi:hypothetical protein
MRWTFGIIVLLVAALAAEPTIAAVTSKVAFACVYELKHTEGSRGKLTNCNEVWTESGDNIAGHIIDWLIDKIPGATELVEIVTEVGQWVEEGETAPAPGFIRGRITFNNPPHGYIYCRADVTWPRGPGLVHQTTVKRTGVRVHYAFRESEPGAQRNTAKIRLRVYYVAPKYYKKLTLRKHAICSEYEGPVRRS